MLFLFNDTIIEVDAPEIHLLRRAKYLGCDDPHHLRARDAIELATAAVSACLAEDRLPGAALIADLAALIIAKTGANAALFPIHGTIAGEPRLTILPESILEALRDQIALEGRLPDMREIWPLAA